MNAPTSARLRRKANRAAWVARYLIGTDRPARTDWQTDAACKGLAPESVNVDMCTDCPVRLECLHDAYRAERDEPTHCVFFVRGGLPATARAAALTAQRRAAAAAALVDVHPLVAAVMEADRHVDNRQAVA